MALGRRLPVLAILSAQAQAGPADPGGGTLCLIPAGKQPMPKIRSLCVYCGSSGAVASAYRAAASELGARLAEAGIELVFGGGRVGLMGLARRCRARARAAG